MKQTVLERIAVVGQEHRTVVHPQRLTAGFCWPWSSSLDENGDFVKDVAIGNFAMPSRRMHRRSTM